MINGIKAGITMLMTGVMGSMATEAPVIEDLGTEIQRYGLLASVTFGSLGIIVIIIFHHLNLKEARRHNEEKERMDRLRFDRDST